VDSDEPDRGQRFTKRLGEVLLECLCQTEELFPYLVAGMTYHLIFDPSAVNVATRLDLLSIDPDKWTPRS
jgi:hypothetical protein